MDMGLRTRREARGASEGVTRRSFCNFAKTCWLWFAAQHASTGGQQMPERPVLRRRDSRAKNSTSMRSSGATMLWKSSLWRSITSLAATHEARRAVAPAKRVAVLIGWEGGRGGGGKGSAGEGRRMWLGV